MLNRSGISKTTLTATKQILANVELQSSVGCIVKKDTSGIVKAGTPLAIDLNNLTAPAEVADASTHAMNAILLHDVDATKADANGTALIFGFVNLNRIDSGVQSKITTALMNAAASKLITFMSV